MQLTNDKWQVGTYNKNIHKFDLHKSMDVPFATCHLGGILINNFQILPQSTLEDVHRLDIILEQFPPHEYSHSYYISS
jgi:hypothetical protein